SDTHAVLIDQKVLQTINVDIESVSIGKDLVVGLRFRGRLDLGKIKLKIYGLRLGFFRELILDKEVQISKKVKITSIHRFKQLFAERTLVGQSLAPEFRFHAFAIQIEDDLRFCLLPIRRIADRWLGGKLQMHRAAATGRDCANRESTFETVSVVAVW